MHNLDFDFLATYPIFTVNVKNYLKMKSNSG